MALGKQPHTASIFAITEDRRFLQALQRGEVERPSWHCWAAQHHRGLVWNSTKGRVPWPTWFEKQLHSKVFLIITMATTRIFITLAYMKCSGNSAFKQQI